MHIYVCMDVCMHVPVDAHHHQFLKYVCLSLSLSTQGNSKYIYKYIYSIYTCIYKEERKKERRKEERKKKERKDERKERKKGKLKRERQ